ncbi:MAG: hypothetical protein WA324_26175 [Bryobacteraceae bacterium]
MGLADWFSTFCRRIQIMNTGVIATRFKTITECLNKDFWDTSSEIDHSLYVGSYGRNTAAAGLSDVDILFQLPYSVWKEYDAYTENGQAALLQEFRASITKTYSKTSIRPDGQGIRVPFTDGLTFEIIPAFLNKDTSYTFLSSLDGGSWRTANPAPESAAIQARNDACNFNLVPLCRMMRGWRKIWEVPISGLLIDTLAYEFFGNYQNRNKSYRYYDFMCRDFFEWMAAQNSEQEYWEAPGSLQRIYGKGAFQHKASRCQQIAIEAIDHETANPSREWSAKQKWREIFGATFPD